jgi:hypothetical protein
MERHFPGELEFQPFLRFYMMIRLLIRHGADPCVKFQPFLRFYVTYERTRNLGAWLLFQPFLRFYRRKSALPPWRWATRRGFQPFLRFYGDNDEVEGNILYIHGGFNPS